jgi:hypothetical protein
VQVIERANDTRQFYFICPAAVAQALGIVKGEAIDWEIEDRETLRLRRTTAPPRAGRRGPHAR